MEAYGIGDSLGALGQVHDIAKESFNKFVDFTKMGTFGMIDMVNNYGKKIISLLNKKKIVILMLKLYFIVNIFRKVIGTLIYLFYYFHLISVEYVKLTLYFILFT